MRVWLECLCAVLFGLPIKGMPVTHGIWWLGIPGGFLFGMGASFGALLLGVSSGLLFLLEGTWTYTNYLREQTKDWLFDGLTPGWLRGALVLALFVGMLASSLHRGSFSWRRPNVNHWQRRVPGGLLMGVGGALVPGGNDTLILALIPTLSVQALASYVALLAGIGSALLIMHLQKLATLLNFETPEPGKTFLRISLKLSNRPNRIC